MFAVVINLDRRSDRYEDFKKRCPLPKVERVSAIDGNLLSSYNDAFIKKYVATGKVKNPNELGCALSHYLLWTKIQNMPPETNVIIMEDDVEFAEDFNKVIVPNNIELLYLGGRGIWAKDFKPKPEELDIGWKKIEFNAGSRELYIRIPSKLRNYCVDRCTECYIINAKAAKKLVIALENKLLDQPIDGLINHFFYDNNIQVLEIFPHPCYVKNRDDSDIVKVYNPKISYNIHVNNRNISLSSTLKIGFVDFWPNFNVQYNFFYLWLFNYLKNKPEKFTDIIVDNQHPDLLFYSVFGQEHVKYNCRKIFYTGENIRPKLDEFYSLGFDYQTGPDNNNYSRLPLWYLFLDLYKCDVTKIGDPFPLPLNRPVPLKRDRFCAFVTSGASFFRDSFFKLLSLYKPVDSAGSNLNNTLELQLISQRNDVSWPESKCKFLEQYKFCIAFENASNPGYVTEKLIHAKMSGTIPIYWGDNTADKQFNTKAFINVHDYPNIDQVINEIKRLDTDDEARQEMTRQPLFLTDLYEPLNIIASNILKKLN
jgi:GR25 family glycosyltransferase involved in LPS biosynthesis